MKNSTRIKKEIALLCERGTYMTCGEIAVIFDISPSTVRIDIAKINDLAKQKNLHLVIKRGIGVKLCGEKDVLDRFKSDNDGNASLLDELSFEILVYLLRNASRFVTIKSLSRKLSSSESAIKNRIVKINVLLEKYNLKITCVKNRGIRIAGSENSFRKLFIDYVIDYIPAIPLNRQKDTADQIMNVLKIDSTKIFKIIDKAQTLLKMKLSEESCNALAIHIAIAIVRIRKGQSPPFIATAEHGHEKEYEVSRLMAKDISKAYDIVMTDSEIHYLFLHLISMRVLSIDSAIDVNDAKTAHIGGKIVRLVETVKQITIEQKYINNLLIHLRPMLNRMKYGIEMNNPLLEDIKNRYPESYGIAWMCNQLFVNECNKTISENEAGYLAIHIQTMIASSLPKVSAVIVCASGVGISQLLKIQIEQKFKNITIVDVCGLEAFKKSNYQNLGLVISSMELKTDYPLITVSPILTQENIAEITNFLSGINPYERKIEIITKLQENGKSQSELIEASACDLQSRGYVKDGFAHSLLKREKVNSTAIGMKTAIPHAAMNTIIKPALYIVTLNKPIVWGDEETDLLVFPLVNEENKEWMIPQLKHIYRKLLNKETHDKLVEETDLHEVERILK